MNGRHVPARKGRGHTEPGLQAGWIFFFAPAARNSAHKRGRPFGLWQSQRVFPKVENTRLFSGRSKLRQVSEGRRVSAGGRFSTMEYPCSAPSVAAAAAPATGAAGTGVVGAVITDAGAARDLSSERRRFPLESGNSGGAGRPGGIRDAISMSLHGGERRQHDETGEHAPGTCIRNHGILH
jgi:hypothetical protein